MNFFEKVILIINSDTSRNISRKTGLSRAKVQRMANGMPFIVDWNVLIAFSKMGYTLKLVKRRKK